MLDLVYTDSSGHDVGILSKYVLDLAFGSDENDFSLVLDGELQSLDFGAMIFCEGTDYGGIVRRKKISTETGITTFCGDTWQGILKKHFICPDADTFTYSADANTFLAQVIKQCGLSGVFIADPALSGIKVNFTTEADNAYSIACKGLATAGARLDLTRIEKSIVVRAVPIATHVVDSDQMPFYLDITGEKFNHLICRGDGLRVDVFADAQGRISEKQTLFGLDEICEFGDYSTDVREELIELGIDELKALRDVDAAEVTSYITEDFAVGDIVECFDAQTGDGVRAEVTKKIVKITDGFESISIELGNAEGAHVLIRGDE